MIINNFRYKAKDTNFIISTNLLTDKSIQINREIT